MILAVMTVVVTLCALGTASAAPETWYVKTPNGGTLNVRDMYDPEIVIGKLPYGEKVTVEYFDKPWAVIVYGSHGSAFVADSFLVKKNPGKYNGDSKTDNKGTVLTDSVLGSQTVEGLNKQYATMKYVAAYSVKVVPDTKTGTARLRWAPSKNSTLIALLPANYELTVLAANNSWLMVQDPANGRIGYIATKYTAVK